MLLISRFPDCSALKDTRGISVLWMQLGVINHAAAGRAAAAGLKVVMDRCPKIEYSRLPTIVSVISACVLLFVHCSGLAFHSSPLYVIQFDGI